MKVSIITVVYNNHKTIANAIQSVLNQDYPDIEYIVVDGDSTDGTLEIIQQYRHQIAKLISESDRGMYDAMNKGIQCATGDIIGMLNSDDFYPDTTTLSTVVREFQRHPVDIVFGDLVFVRPDNLDRIIRYYSCANFHPRQFAWGWMPAHPTVFVKRDLYQKYGLFKIDYQIASDYELMVRFLAKHRAAYRYIPKVLVKMRTGGISTKNLASNWILNREIVRGCAENGISTNMLRLLLKYPTKILQLVQRPQL